MDNVQNLCHSKINLYFDIYFLHYLKIVGERWLKNYFRKDNESFNLLLSKTEHPYNATYTTAVLICPVCSLLSSTSTDTQWIYTICLSVYKTSCQFSISISTCLCYTTYATFVQQITQTRCQTRVFRSWCNWTGSIPLCQLDRRLSGTQSLSGRCDREHCNFPASIKSAP
jgi:hypothetical protein